MIDPASSAAARHAGQTIITGNGAARTESPEEKKSFDGLVEEFLKWSRMNPAERIRAQYLKAHGLTEESLTTLSLEKQEAIEKEIKDLIEEQLAVGDDTDEELERMKQVRHGDQAMENLFAMRSALLDNQEAASE